VSGICSTLGALGLIDSKTQWKLIELVEQAYEAAPNGGPIDD